MCLCKPIFSDIGHLVANIRVLCEQNVFITENNILVNDLVLETSVNPSSMDFSPRNSMCSLMSVVCFHLPFLHPRH